MAVGVAQARELLRGSSLRAAAEPWPWRLSHSGTRHKSSASSSNYVCYVCCSAYINCSWTILDRATLNVRHMFSYDELLGDFWGYAAMEISGEQPAWYLGISYALLSLNIAFLSCAFLQVFPLYSSPCLSFLAPVQPPCPPRHAKTALPSA
jgi:hypothetical protein